MAIIRKSTKKKKKFLKDAIAKNKLAHINTFLKKKNLHTLEQYNLPPKRNCRCLKYPQLGKIKEF